MPHIPFNEAFDWSFYDACKGILVQDATQRTLINFPINTKMGFRLQMDYMVMGDNSNSNPYVVGGIKHCMIRKAGNGQIGVSTIANLVGPVTSGTAPASPGTLDVTVVADAANEGVDIKVTGIASTTLMITVRFTAVPADVS